MGCGQLHQWSSLPFPSSLHHAFLALASDCPLTGRGSKGREHCSRQQRERMGWRVQHTSSLGGTWKQQLKQQQQQKQKQTQQKQTQQQKQQ
ncbi:hypothetical protein CLOM_g23671 [Closterium sp. NIES-68]|nr:hypothetical protein CLOM_g23671 [Closterium sp. NIES-68]GJP86894.1 hypothetical protein CLOP_g16866 [Closterium sp. NIES-67]